MEAGIGNGYDYEGHEHLDAAESTVSCLSGFVDRGSSESHRLFLARRTVLMMLKDRGYAVAVSEINLPLQEFRAIYGQVPDIDRLRISVTHQSDPSKRMLVVFGGPSIVKVNIIRGIATQIMNKDSLTGLILILQNQITNQARKAVDLLPFKVEIFQKTEEGVDAARAHMKKPKEEGISRLIDGRVLPKPKQEESQVLSEEEGKQLILQSHKSQILILDLTVFESWNFPPLPLPTLHNWCHKLPKWLTLISHDWEHCQTPFIRATCATNPSNHFA